jgi:hypothetical protein
VLLALVLLLGGSTFPLLLYTTEVEKCGFIGGYNAREGAVIDNPTPPIWFQHVIIIGVIKR